MFEGQLGNWLRRRQCRDPPEERAVGDLQLEAGERLAQALVHSVPEGEMVAGGAVDVQGISVRERGRIAVGHVGGRDDPLAGAVPRSAPANYGHSMCR